MTDVDLSVDLAGLTLATPILTASGTFGYGEEFADFVDFAKLGAITVKGTTLKPRLGNEGIRIAETPSGMLNAIGLQNPGVEYFLQTILPRIRELPTNIIVNISGASSEEYGELAAILDKADGVAAIELNVSCPNVKDGGMIFGTDEQALTEVTKAAKRQTNKPVIVKLSPNVTNIVDMAKAAEQAGADALSLINTLLGMDIDVERRRPLLGNITGGLSGRAVLPVALRMVYEVSRAVQIPVIGMGGAATWQDAVKFLLAGARAVAVGTANFTDPTTTMKIVAGLREYMEQNSFSHIADIKMT